MIFVPCDFAAVLLFLFYISCAAGGNWFFSFALPVTAGIGLIVTATVTLLRYLRHGILYILGGAFCGLGLFMPLVGFLLNLTFFHTLRFALWSLYPLTALVILGGTLIFLAICQPAREIMERKFFI